MTSILEFIFGPAVPDNPNYEVIQDIASLIPWWYPHLIAGCMLLLLTLLWVGYCRKSAKPILGTALTSKLRGLRPHGH